MSSIMRARTGILTAQLSGFDVGSLNEKLLRENFTSMERQIREYATIIDEHGIGYPVDFVLSQRDNTSQSNRYNVPVRELTKPKYEEYEIFDIGSETVKRYVKHINTGVFDWRIRAGPNGVFEDGFNNGINLIEHLL
jgi:3-phosphoglycerate kinase